MFLAKPLHRSAAGDAVARLQRASAIVNSGVDDTAVVSGLVSGDTVFFFDDQQTFAGKAPGVFESGGKPDNACADDEEICLAISHERLPGGKLDYTEGANRQVVITDTSGDHDME